MKDGVGPGGRTEEVRGGLVKLGVDRLLDSPEEILGPLASGSKLALLTNDGSRPTPGGARKGGVGPTRKALLEAGVPLARLFTPEHGLSASVQDGEAVPHGTDAETGLPVTSLYGRTLVPRDEVLEDMDLVLVDLQDVGARFYTYLWTLSHVMEACARARVPVWILDRPNPLGGRQEWVEGPLPDADSPPTFLGRWPVPIRHSLTLGELALLLRKEMALNLTLEVVAMEGWRRDLLWPDTHLPFHPPSPGIPSFHAALLYPGLALLEATNVSEGRGTHLAFQWLGAPWMDGQKMAAALNDTRQPGIQAQPHSLVIPPTSSPCPGIFLEITDPEAVRPVALGLHLVSLLPTLWPDRFRWTPYPTAVNPHGHGHLLRLLGRRAVVEALMRNPERVHHLDISEWIRTPDWWRRAESHLLYA